MPILVFAFTSLVIGWMTNRRSWFATSMIVLFSGATIMFNLAHAEILDLFQKMYANVRKPHFFVTAFIGCDSFALRLT